MTTPAKAEYFVFYLFEIHGMKKNNWHVAGTVLIYSTASGTYDHNDKPPYASPVMTVIMDHFKSFLPDLTLKRPFLPVD